VAGATARVTGPAAFLTNPTRSSHALPKWPVPRRADTEHVPADPTVLIVEDEPSIADILDIALRFHGFTTLVAHTGRRALETARAERPDLVLLDVMLPDATGWQVCRDLRAEHAELAIVFLTARDAAPDIVGGLTVGGDDYITKPFNVDEVVARIRAVLRRVSRAQPRAAVGGRDVHQLPAAQDRGAGLAAHRHPARGRIRAVDTRVTRRPHSLRARLTAANVTLLAAGLVVFAVGSSWALQRNLVGQVDDDLRTTRAALQQARLDPDAIAATVGPDGLVNRVDPGPDPRLRTHTTLVRVSPDRTGVPVDGGPGTEQAQLAAAVPDPVALASSESPTDVHVNGQKYRATAVQLDDGTVILAGSSLEPVEQTRRRVMLTELAVGAALLLTLALVSLMAARRRLRPLEDMVATATAIAAGDMSRRVPTRGPASTEVEQLRTALNTMLHRVTDAADTRERTNAQLRQFAADASHELRTPLTAIRGYLQLADRGMLDSAALRRALDRMGTEADRMAHLVNELLELARLEQAPQLHLDRVDLAALAHDAAADLRALEPRRPVRLDLPDGELAVRGDETHLRRVLANLVSNVQAHTPPHAAVTLSARRADSTATVRITDTGPGMAVEDAARVFDRFFRADPDRSHGAGGSGLGMSIVRAVIEAHSGTVDLDTAPGHGLTITITLPTPSVATEACC
jgi:two-component system, OmpR family, sensor kinase